MREVFSSLKSDAEIVEKLVRQIVDLGAQETDKIQKSSNNSKLEV